MDRFKEAKEILEKIDGETKIFEVEWTWKVTWYVEAKSMKEAEEAAENISDYDLNSYRDDPFLDISSDLVARARRDSEKMKRKINPPVSDSGVFKGKIIHISEYIAQKVWELVEDVTNGDMTCLECGYSGLAREFNLNTETPEHGHIPILGCPSCRVPIDLKDFLSERLKEKDEKTLLLFGEGEKYGKEERSDGSEA